MTSFIQEIDKAIAASKSEMETGSKPEEAPGPSGAAGSTGSKSGSGPVDSKVTQIVQMTKCSEQAAREALEKFGGDPDAAALSILTSGLTKS